MFSSPSPQQQQHIPNGALDEEILKQVIIRAPPPPPNLHQLQS